MKGLISCSLLRYTFIYHFSIMLLGCIRVLRWLWMTGLNDACLISLIASEASF